MEKRTERLDIVLVETALDILDHQTCFSYLRVTDHPDLDNHTEEKEREGGESEVSRNELQKHNRALIALIAVLCTLGLGLLRVGGRHEKWQWQWQWVGGSNIIYIIALELDGGSQK